MSPGEYLPLLALMLADPKVQTSEEAPRLTAQCQAVYERLQQGPASNAELVTIATRFGARLHDLRGSGIEIEIISRDRKSGLVWYALGAA